MDDMIDDFMPKLPKRKLKPDNKPAETIDTATNSKPDTLPFKTPEEVAAHDSSDYVEKTSDESAGQSSTDEGRWQALLQWRPTRKQWIIIAGVAVVLIAGITTLILTHHSKPKISPAIKAITVKPKPSAPVILSDLTGLPISSASINKLPVTGIMIENSDDARPQSGLGQAGIVFEAVAEGGVTRFMALFQDSAPSNIGPIRSARPYYIQWCLGFDCAYSHVGGSPDGLADIKSWGVHDLDEFANGGSYHRISTRAAPHNVYTSISTLNELENTKGYTTSTYTSWPRKADSPSKTPTASTISMNLSGPDYNPQYTYSATTNSYLRSEGGAPQMDANTNTQVSPKVVIAIVVPESQGALDASGAYYSNYNPIGSGSAYVFQDGTETTGTWTKSSNTAQLTFTTAAGQPLKLNAGQTWVTAITTPTNVTYK
jgi:hypothetical protein